MTMEATAGEADIWNLTPTVRRLARPRRNPGKDALDADASARPLLEQRARLRHHTVTYGSGELYGGADVGHARRLWKR